MYLWSRFDFSTFRLAEIYFCGFFISFKSKHHKELNKNLETALFVDISKFFGQNDAKKW